MTRYEMPKPGAQAAALSPTDRETMERHEERKAMTEKEKPPLPTRISTAGHGGMPGGMFTTRHRERECRACGQTFTQYELSKSMDAWVASLPETAQQLWAATVNEGGLPLFCITCERRELGRVPLIVEVPPARQSAA